MKKTKKKAPKKSSQSGNRMEEINLGRIEARTLAECLKIDFRKLYASIFPNANPALLAEIGSLQKIGILKRMGSVAQIALREEGKAVLKKLSQHPSDTARGWAAFIVGILPNLPLADRMELIRPFADDSHFGVREWAWMAVRPHLSANLKEGLVILESWTEDSSFRVRRFASEAIRPRGVWAEHIATLKEKPEMALPVLSKLKNDTERYVQDSVANWLNDAAKSKPEWVKKICAEWTKKSQSAPTLYITKRAQRSIT